MKKPAPRVVELYIVVTVDIDKELDDVRVALSDALGFIADEVTRPGWDGGAYEFGGADGNVGTVADVNVVDTDGLLGKDDPTPETAEA